MNNEANPLIHLQERLFFKLFIGPLSKSVRAMELYGDHVRITQRRKTVSLSLRSLVAPPALGKGFFGTTLRISSGTGETFTLQGADYGAAQAFSVGVKTAWVRFNLAALGKEASRLDRTLEDIRALVRPTN